MKIGEFAKLAVEMAAAMELGFTSAMEECGSLVEKEAKDMIGTYQTDLGPFRDWQPLAQTTRERKTQLGFSPPDKPLERFGFLRDSIEHSASAWKVNIGSNDQVAVDQELGTNTIPPRSFLGGAAYRKADEVVELIWAETEAILLGGGVARSFLPKKL